MGQVADPGQRWTIPHNAMSCSFGLSDWEAVQGTNCGSVPSKRSSLPKAQQSRVHWRRSEAPVATQGSFERHRLTQRETQVLVSITGGLSNRQTAAEMRVSVKTVEKHRQSVMNKLRIHEIAGLTKYAIAREVTFDGERPVDSEVMPETCECSGLRVTAPALKQARITDRQAEVLKLIAEGKANKQIASDLNVSIKTVDNHRQHIMKRLDIHKIAGLTRYAVAQGITTIRPLAFRS